MAWHGVARHGLAGRGMAKQGKGCKAMKNTQLIEQLASKADLAALEASIVKWLVPLLLGQAALIVALVKLL